MKDDNQMVTINMWKGAQSPGKSKLKPQWGSKWLVYTNLYDWN